VLDFLDTSSHVLLTCVYLIHGIGLITRSLDERCSTFSEKNSYKKRPRQIDRSPLLKRRQRNGESMKTVKDIFDRMDPGPYKYLVAKAVESDFVKWEDPYNWGTYRRLKIFVKRHLNANKRTIDPGLAG